MMQHGRMSHRTSAVAAPTVPLARSVVMRAPARQLQPAPGPFPSAAAPAQQRLAEQQPVASTSTSYAELPEPTSRRAAVAALQESPMLPAAADVPALLRLLVQQVQPQLLSLRQRQQLTSMLDRLAATLLDGLAELPRDQSVEALQHLMDMGHCLSPKWVRSMLQHAATDLNSYTPEQLVVLITAASRAAVQQQQQQQLRLRSVAPPQQQQQQQRLWQPLPGANSSSSSSRPQHAGSPNGASSSSSSSVQPVATQQQQQQASPTIQQQQQQDRELSGQQQQQDGSFREAPVVTRAWLSHYMTTFERFLAGRAAHPSLSPQHMEQVVRALTALGAQPDKSWLYLYVRQLSSQIGECPPSLLVGIVSLLGQLGYQLPDHVATQFERQVGAHLRVLRPAELAAALSAFAHMRHKPSETWVRSLLSQALRGSHHLNASAVVGLMAGAAALGHTMEHGWIDLLMLQIRHLLAGFAPHEHVGLMSSLSHQQYRPAPSFMADWMAAMQQRLPELSLEQLAVLLAALGQVGYKPSPQWMRGTMLQLLQRPVGPTDAPSLLRLLRALKRMQYTPSGDIMAGLEAHVDGIAVQLLFPQVQELRAALTALEYVPYVPAAAAAAAAAAVEEVGEQSEDGAPAAAAVASGTDEAVPSTSAVAATTGSSSAAPASTSTSSSSEEGAGEVSGVVSGPATSASQQPAPAAVGSSNVTLTDRLVVAAGAVAAAAAASAAAPLQ